MDWIALAQDRDKRQAVVDTAMNFRVTQNAATSCLAEKLAAFQEQLRSMESVSLLLIKYLCHEIRAFPGYYTQGGNSLR